MGSFLSFLYFSFFLSFLLVLGRKDELWLDLLTSSCYISFSLLIIRHTCRHSTAPFFGRRNGMRISVRLVSLMMLLLLELRAPVMILFFAFLSLPFPLFIQLFVGAHLRSSFFFFFIPTLPTFYIDFAVCMNVCRPVRKSENCGIAS